MEKEPVITGADRPARAKAPRVFVESLIFLGAGCLSLVLLGVVWQVTTSSELDCTLGRCNVFDMLFSGSVLQSSFVIMSSLYYFGLFYFSRLLMWIVTRVMKLRWELPRRVIYSVMLWLILSAGSPFLSCVFFIGGSLYSLNLNVGSWMPVGWTGMLDMFDADETASFVVDTDSLNRAVGESKVLREHPLRASGEDGSAESRSVITLPDQCTLEIAVSPLDSRKSLVHLRHFNPAQTFR